MFDVAKMKQGLTQKYKNGDVNAKWLAAGDFFRPDHIFYAIFVI
jgi:hypothetical protein